VNNLNRNQREACIRFRAEIKQSRIHWRLIGRSQSTAAPG
jgi:hypothetical protein